MQRKRVFISSVQVMLFADRLEVSNPGSLPYELTIDKLYIPHRSIPANPLIAETMYLRGTIERMGTGTEELANLCIGKGLRRPDFIQEGDFRSILYRSAFELAESREKDSESSEKSSEKDSESSEKSSEKIVSMMRSNPTITIEELSVLLSKTTRAIEKNLTKLKAKGLIERVGPDKGGHWKVLKE